MSNIKEYEFVPYKETSRPGILFSLAPNSHWEKVSILLHSKYDFPEAKTMNGANVISLSNDTFIHHKLETQKKVSKRIGTRKSPCVQYEYQTCKNIEDNKLVLDQFSCHIPFLYFGPHLDHIITSKTPKCNKSVTMEAIDQLMNKRTKCAKFETCTKIRYQTIHKPVNQESKNKINSIFVAFGNPEVEYRNTYISYDLLSLIGELGGILGLTLGASAMALIDLMFQNFTYY